MNAGTQGHCSCRGVKFSLRRCGGMIIGGMRFPRPYARLVLLPLLLACLVAPAAAADILKIVVDDVIHPISDEFIGRALDEARQKNDSAVLIELRTPGGLEESMRKIVNRIIASPVPVIIYVTPTGSRAASAGFFVLIAADVAVMAPGTNTGAAHPVTLGGERMDDVMKQKVANDAAAFIRSIAAKRGRNVAAAESGVLESKSFTDQEALRLRLIDMIAASEGAMLRDLNGTTVTRFNGSQQTLDLENRTIRVKEMTLRQKVLSFLMNPNIAFLLFSLGIFALWIELTNPGAVLPGVLGALAIVLAVIALNILPTRFAALALILLAFALFALEAFVTSHGVLGIGGAIALFIGGLMLVDGPIPELRVHWGTALGASIALALIAIFLMTMVVRTHRRKPSTGEIGMLGEIGTAETDIDPNGRVFVHGEIWFAASRTPVSKGQRVVVRGVQGLELQVEPAAGEEPPGREV
jgi:membrane-bound serine protease (ClpP class)